MKTDELIDLLSTDVEPVPRSRVPRMIGIAVVLAGATALALILFTYGIRNDLDSAGALAAMLLKLAFALVIAIPAAIYLMRLARPGGERNIPLPWLGLPFGAIVLVALINLALAPMSHWDDLVAGRDWLECLVSIPIIAIVPFAVLVWAVRQMAPTDLTRTGALVGLVAGGLSAAGYALHCVDDSVPFVALWYSATIALCTLAGAKLGPRLLRW
jgi:hypothetical protein